jgi:lipopolysaccharide export system protein LptC
MSGVLMVLFVLAIAVGCLIGFGGNRNREGTVHMNLSQNNLAYVMDDTEAQPVNREARRARGRQ